MNSVFFRLINIFFIFGCWLLPEKFSFCSKNNGFARVWGVAAPPALLARRKPVTVRREKNNGDMHKRITEIGNNITYLRVIREIAYTVRDV